MSDRKLSTDPYKGVRDFYPEDMAIQRYIFETWSTTAESFGFERYDASVLEPSELYKSKGAENEEMVNEQTYTFTDRGDREVTLRPEMTPTVARMVSGRKRELTFPLRWYSIPNLFRYERTQRGRLREHWQLNCDIFGADDLAADAEAILLAHQIFVNFGATSEMFEIRINNRGAMTKAYEAFGLEPEKIPAVTKLNDRKAKISSSEYRDELERITEDTELTNKIIELIDSADDADDPLLAALSELGVTNVRIDRSLARGFDYYTGTIFEIFDTASDNNRSMLGGGRYDNLTSLFEGEPVSGIGFGMGDVTMRNFLETHALLENKVPTSAPILMIIPMTSADNLEGEKLAQAFRAAGLSAAVNIGSRKTDKKRQDAEKVGSKYLLQVGENERATGTYTVKNLHDSSEQSGTLEQLLEVLTV